MQRISITGIMKGFFIFGGIVSGILCAQSEQQELLPLVREYYTDRIPFAIDFDITEIYDSSAYQSFAGTFYLGTDQKFRVDYTDQVILYDGQWLWSLDRANDQVVLEELDPESSLKFMFDLLHGRWEQFDIEGLAGVSADSLPVIRLKTRNENDFFQLIRLKIDPAQRRIVATEYEDFRGQLTRMSFTQPQRINKPEEVFNQQIFLGKELIDLRP